MGSLNFQKGFIFMLFISSYSFFTVSSEDGTVFIDGKTAIAKIDEDFICATLDWWPPEKCDYGTCSWDHASLINLVCFQFLPFSCFGRLY